MFKKLNSARFTISSSSSSWCGRRMPRLSQSASCRVADWVAGASLCDCCRSISSTRRRCRVRLQSIHSYPMLHGYIVRGLADRDDLDCLWFALHDFGISACEHWTDVSGERTLTNRHHTRPYSTKEVYEGEVVWKSCYSNSSEWPHRSLDRYIVFARWCQCEPPSNTRFLGPTGVCPLKRYLKFSIGSAVLLYFVAWR